MKWIKFRGNVKTERKVFLREMKCPLCTYSRKPNLTFQGQGAALEWEWPHFRLQFALTVWFIEDACFLPRRKVHWKFHSGCFWHPESAIGTDPWNASFLHIKVFYYDTWSGKSKLAFFALAVKKQEQHLTVGCHVFRISDWHSALPLGQCLTLWHTWTRPYHNIITAYLHLSAKNGGPFSHGIQVGNFVCCTIWHSTALLSPTNNFFNLHTKHLFNW